MENVPKIVLKRLQREAGTAAEWHPDADILTAFSERTLTNRELDEVVEHLTRCGDCREAVMLALPATGSAPIVAAPSRSGWLSWPRLRWGLAAAGMLLVASVGVLEYQHRQQNTGTEMVSKLSPENEMPAVGQGLPASNETAIPALSSPQVRTILPSAASQEKSADGLSSSDVSRHKNGLAKRGVAGTSEAVDAQSATEQVATTERNNGQKTDLSARRPSMNADVVARAKEPVSAAGTGSTSAPGFAPSAFGLQNSPSLMLHALPRWSISAAGVLQRSFDAGKTWESVNMTLAPSAGFQAQVVDGNVAAGNEVKAGQEAGTNVVFRAVAAVGPEVWAGGSGAALYHSVDSGTHWVQVQPLTSDATLTGEVVLIEFSDPQHGLVSTSTSERWSTSDGGATWGKEQ
ncbi:MAG: hypothetical protein WBX38_06650 [Candidatus Sulfotelmatobacter sp.]